jgi:threonylcarbamoyladenosine tRNA methylthiotransferase MtaB
MSKKSLQTYSMAVLGCKVNQYDARQIEEILQRYGLQDSGKNTADIIVVHTCGVTTTAARKSRQTICKLMRQHHDAHLIITGCAATDDLSNIYTKSVLRIPAGKEWLKQLATTLEQWPLPRTQLADSIETDETIVNDFKNQTRAYLKIQDGCDIGCSYCIVPSLRKSPRDKSPQTALLEAKNFTAKGYREIVITGVSVGLYGKKTGNSLAHLLREITRIPDIGRIRMSSLHPAELTDELLEVWSATKQMMPHIHLSLQSGSDEILKSMRRGYTTNEYLAAIEKARYALDNPAFTTDVIVGFPGETEAHFQETIDFCKRIGFSRIHVFSYSKRPGTPAATMPNQIDGKIASQRNTALQELAATLSHAFHRQFIGQQIPVLLEGSNQGTAEGYSPHYVPVKLAASPNRAGSIVKVLVESASKDGVYGKLVF